MLGHFLPLRCIVLVINVLALTTGAGALARPSQSAEQLLLNQANSDRSARNLTPLRNDPLLSQAARYHAEQMAQHADISHGFPGEPSLSLRGAYAGVHFSLITENVAETGDPAIIHDLWMHSPGHRANLLDPAVNVVGIAVVVRDDAVYAVEDFAATVDALSFDEQESTVSNLLSQNGLAVDTAEAETLRAARQTCSMESGYAGQRQPRYIMRYTASRLDTLPEQLRVRLATGRYRQAVVGACAPAEGSAFTSYTIAILLFP